MRFLGKKRGILSFEEIMEYKELKYNLVEYANLKDKGEAQLYVQSKEEDTEWRLQAL